ncbi:hypothetical protein Gotur_000566 [Gossypium turneri]
MLQTLGGLKSSRKMLVDEQVDVLFKKTEPIKLILQTQGGNSSRIS